jgi:uncharacterized repeat protein (TIGR01451 family)
VQFVGTDRRLNVFTVSASTLQDAERIEIGVPGGRATTLINVTGASYTSAQRPTVAVAFNTADPVGTSFSTVGSGDVTSDNAMARARVVWSFPEADTVQIGSTTGPSMAWEGTVFAPKATVLLGETARLHGTIVALRLEQTGTVRLPTMSAVCLPPPCGPPGPDPDPGPDPEPPPLPPEPIPPAPPGATRPPDTGDVAGELSGSTRLAMCKRRSRARVTAGRTVSFRLEVRNIGLATALDVVVCDPLPAGLRIVRARGAEIRGDRACWRIDSLRAERTLRLTARPNLTASGVFRNVARARAANARTARGRARIRVLAADPFNGRPPPAKGP